jgi:phenylalanyl-tRNA synthetase beta chain
MKISYNWLKDYLAVELSPDNLSELLTNCGLEVEGLEKWQSVRGGMEGIVIGEVKRCAKHPDADRLSVTTVDIGQGRLLPIVCGAPNVATGQKVLVATVGTLLYKEEESFEIKKAKIRGEVSEGMICAEDELGIGTDHEGVVVLPENTPVGMPAAEYFNIVEDYIFEIGLTPNRTDAMSHIGVARDIKAVLENMDFIAGKKKSRKLQLPAVDSFKTENKNLDIPVIVENPEACPRYAGVTLSGIQVKESPDWLKNRLNAIGLRPINNIVDITNYVLHETGQPLHAFDAAEIKGNRVVVRKMAEGSTFITLDEVERKLSADDLMICNATDGMCIGGVFGGITSGVTEKTTSIFLESAYFDPVHIRKTSKYHDLQTDASFRFERGADPGMTLYALKRASLLIGELAGGTVSSELKDVYHTPLKPVNCSVSWKNIDRLIGKAIGKEAIKNILNSLDFEILKETKDGLSLNVPLYRVDVTREADVIEEILRIYGYNNIEIGTQLRSSISRAAKPDPENVRAIFADYLGSNGFTEIMNNSLTRAAYYEGNPDFDGDAVVPIFNPLSRDLNVMRGTLLYGGLETILHNQNRKINDLKLFEFGQVYSRYPDVEKTREVTEKYREQSFLGLFLTGRKQPESWKTGDDESDYFDLKSICQNLLKRAGIKTNRLKYSEDVPAFMHQGVTFRHGKSEIMRLGNLSSKLLKEFDIKQPVYYGELNMDLVFKLLDGNKIRYSEIPKFPEVRRDLALLLDKGIAFAEVEKIAFETERAFLKEVNLFDVYEGKNIESGKKSYAVSFVLQDAEKTLTDKVIDKVMNKLIGAYTKRLAATIR